MDNTGYILQALGSMEQAAYNIVVAAKAELPDSDQRAVFKEAFEQLRVTFRLLNSLLPDGLRLTEGEG